MAVPEMVGVDANWDDGCFCFEREKAKSCVGYFLHRVRGASSAFGKNRD